MYRILLLPLVLGLVGIPVAPAAGVAQEGDAGQRDARIRSALSAAPASVAEKATVVDLDGTVLKHGSSDWVCMPDMPDVPNDSPMCLDEPWREVIDAWENRREPEYTGIGISYMLQGDMPVSNIDPFAEGPAPGNEWIPDGPPHIMVLVSDHELLESLPTDPDNGGPWVMWKGTPYAHIMIPTVPRPE